MTASSLARIFTALEKARVRYMVAGGLAVVAHGFVRFTNDVDIVLDLEKANCLRALRALADLGYRPLVPVEMEEFADAASRRRWAEEKGAKVFQLFSDAHPRTCVDLFLELPFDFDEAFERCHRQEAAEGVRVPFVGLEELLVMKRLAGRAQDRVDVEKLEQLRDHRTGQE